MLLPLAAKGRHLRSATYLISITGLHPSCSKAATHYIETEAMRLRGALLNCQGIRFLPRDPLGVNLALTVHFRLAQCSSHVAYLWRCHAVLLLSIL